MQCHQSMAATSFNIYKKFHEIVSLYILKTICPRHTDCNTWLSPGPSWGKKNHNAMQRYSWQTQQVHHKSSGYDSKTVCIILISRNNIKLTVVYVTSIFYIK